MRGGESFSSLRYRESSPFRLVPSIMSPSCPACSAEIEWREIDFRIPFRCSSCGTELSVSPSYSRSIFFTAIVLAGFAMYVLGARDYVLVFGILFALFPITWVVFVLTAAFMPPRISTTSSSLLDRHERHHRM